MHYRRFLFDGDRCAADSPAGVEKYESQEQATISLAFRQHLDKIALSQNQLGYRLARLAFEFSYQYRLVWQVSRRVYLQIDP